MTCAPVRRRRIACEDDERHPTGTVCVQCACGTPTQAQLVIIVLHAIASESLEDDFWTEHVVSLISYIWQLVLQVEACMPVSYSDSYIT